MLAAARIAAFAAGSRHVGHVGHFGHFGHFRMRNALLRSAHGRAHVFPYAYERYGERNDREQSGTATKHLHRLKSRFVRAVVLSGLGPNTVRQSLIRVKPLEDARSGRSDGRSHRTGYAVVSFRPRLFFHCRK